LLIYPSTTDVEREKYKQRGINELNYANPCFGRHVWPLALAVFAVISTHHWAYGPFSFQVMHKEVLCPSNGDINRLMIMHM
jgi:hypothetical protein